MEITILLYLQIISVRSKSRFPSAVLKTHSDFYSFSSNETLVDNTRGVFAGSSAVCFHVLLLSASACPACLQLELIPSRN